MQTVFIVDDNDVNLMKAKEAVEGEGYQVLTMPSAEKMFAMMEKVTPDLILMDIVMPGMNGYDALSNLRQHAAWENIPVYFLSSWSNEAGIKRALACGAKGFVRKPFVMRELADCVRKALTQAEQAEAQG